MTKKLYVGNLSYTTTEEQVRELFAQAGEVDSVSLITDRETGRAKGFGFVEMNTEDGSREAIKRFNGFSLDNRTLTVNEARPREERSGGGGFGGGGERRSFGGGSGGGDRRGGGGDRRGNDGGYSGNRKRF
jgi:RNA recognition motif-containing protein